MLFGIDIDDEFIEDLCEKTWRSQKSFVYLQGKYDDIFTM